MIGTHLNDRYRLEEKIGSGGMSTVYSAFDPTLERWVAIKLMHRDLSGDPDQLERFRREARAVARLSHPHVVTVIDFGEDDGTPYIVLERVEGETLKDRIRRMGRLPIAEAVAYAIEIGRALSARTRRAIGAPGRQAAERPDRRRRARQGHRLRHRPVARGAGTDRHRPRARHHRLRLARAGARPGGVRAVRSLLARHRAVRDAHRGGAVQGREPGGGGHEARQGHPPRRSAAAPRGIGRSGGGGRSRYREGDEEPLRHGRRDGRRPGGRAGYRGRPLGGVELERPPRCCARCPATRPTWCPCGCATPAAGCSPSWPCCSSPAARSATSPPARRRARAARLHRARPA